MARWTEATRMLQLYKTNFITASWIVLLMRQTFSVDLTIRSMTFRTIYEAFRNKIGSKAGLIEISEFV